MLLPGADLENAPRFLLLNTFLDLRSPDSLQNLQRFAQTVLRRDKVTDAAITLDSLPPRDALRNPYRGLDFFREEDAPLFFGRDEIAQKLLEKIKTCALVALIGNSGTGKSSVVRAGLIPLLRRLHAPDPAWEVIVCNPGINPFQNLASALLESWNYAPAEIFKECPVIETTLRNTLSLTVGISQTLKTSQNADKLLLVIDQFEELITLEKSGVEKQNLDFEPFVELLLNTINAPNCKVLLTIRGDYYGTVTERHAGLAEVIEKGTITLKRLEDKQLREIIEKPATRGGGKLQDGLADLIIDDVGKQPGNLALLEFALTLLWNYQHDGWLTHDAYKIKVGKLESAISNKADEILNSQEVGNPKLALTALTRLVRVSSRETDGGDTRQRVPLNEFNPAERACMEPFVKSRLLVASGSWHESDDKAPQSNDQANYQQGPTLEVAHEALIRHWPTLQDALKDKRELLIWRQTIRPQYEKWQELNKTGSKPEELEAVLLQGYPLKQGLKWLKERPHDLTGDEPKFLQLSQEKAQKEQTIFHFLKRAGIGVACLLMMVMAIQIWAAGHDVSWGFAARAVMIRIAYRVPGLKPGWIPQMQAINPVTFQMGSTPAAIKAGVADSNEGPQHPVTLKPFHIGVYEVKFSEYDEFAKDTSYRCKGKQPEIDDNQWGLDDQHAINASWDDAACYAKWLSFLTGTHYRLPTEAEWEYAARAGTTSDYYWEGQGEAKDFAWFDENSKNKTQPVGQKKPNAFGLYDMSGNVWEWVQDCWHDNYDQAPGNGSAWQEQNNGDCSLRVLRGGSWNNGPVHLRSTNRDRDYPDTRLNNIGFRLAQD